MRYYQGILIIAILLGSIPSLFGQSPYELNWKKELPIILATGVGLTTTVAIYKDYPVHDAASLTLLDDSEIIDFDRTALNNWSPKAGNASDFFFYGSAILPLSLLLDADIRANYKHAGIILGESLLLTEGLTGFTKVLTKRNRPFVYNDDVPLDKKTTKSARMSFFSGHTSTVAVLSFGTAKVFLDHHPDSKLKPVIWAAAATLPAITGYLRVKAGKHYPTDVIAGYGIGALVGFFVPMLHRNKKKKNWKISPNSNDNSLGFILRATF